MLCGIQPDLVAEIMEQHELARIARNWRDERDSAELYAALAIIERNPRLSRVFGKLAESEREHSAYWEEQLRCRGLEVPAFRPSLRTRMMIRLARQLGVSFVLPRITTRELSDQHRYSSQADATAAGLPHEERGHAAVMRRITSYGHSADEGAETSSSASLANNLRAAVLGANDGLASNFCLLMGVAGGGATSSTILLTGVAGLTAGACAMALGEWLSVTNSLEMTRSQMDEDVRELHGSKAWKATELALMFEAQGLMEGEAKQAAERVIAQDANAINTLIQEERLMASAPLANKPTSAAAYSFALFALGAFVPVAPFFVSSSVAAIFASIALSLLALLALGVLTSFFNGRSPLFSGLRQVAIGAAAAAVTYGVGRLFGATLG